MTEGNKESVFNFSLPNKNLSNVEQFDEGVELCSRF